MKYFIQTFGCQMNVADSRFMAGSLSELGLSVAGDVKDADVIVINTCSVRDHAEHRALSFIGRLAPLRRNKSHLKIIVSGCVAQRMGEKLKTRFPQVDLVVGAREIGSFPELLRNALRPFPPAAEEGGGGPAGLPRPSAPTLHRPVSSFITIMRGCDNCCSYCIVPFVRGNEESRPPGEIIAEIAALAANGTREVTLLGQNVNSYRGNSARGTVDFADLLAEVDGIDGLERIRFMTNHPKDLSDRLVERMASLDKVCEHIHLPLQSGADRILAAMNRNYTASAYFALIEKLMQRVPGISITTDILVGFPGETEEEFRETLAVIGKAGFDFLFAFKYSPRPGTRAAALEDDVLPAVKEERLARVLELSAGISTQKNATLIHTVQEVLIEGREEASWYGRTRSNRKVFLQTDKDCAGKFVPVTITGTRLNSLSGDVVS